MPNLPRYEPCRMIPMEGTSNLRDLGGLPTRHGKQTRFGLLYRSAKLSKLTSTDVQRLSALGIRSVCDLRGVAERARDASDHLSGSRLHLLPMEAHLERLLLDILAQREVTAGDIEDFMNTGYEAYPHACAEQLRTLFGLILDESNLPLLFHCAAGKDRTGFCAAVVLTLLGVEWESVLQDYLATNQHWFRDFKLPDGLTEELGAPLFAANEGLLRRSFQVIVTRYGSFDGYVSDVLGINAAARLELQVLLTA